MTPRLMKWCFIVGFGASSWVSAWQYGLGKSDTWYYGVLVILFVAYMIIDPLKGVRDELQ